MSVSLLEQSPLRCFTRRSRRGSTSISRYLHLAGSPPPSSKSPPAHLIALHGDGGDRWLRCTRIHIRTYVDTARQRRGGQRDIPEQPLFDPPPPSLPVIAREGWFSRTHHALALARRSMYSRVHAYDTSPPHFPSYFYLFFGLHSLIACDLSRSWRCEDTLFPVKTPPAVCVCTRATHRVSTQNEREGERRTYIHTYILTYLLTYICTYTMQLRSAGGRGRGNLNGTTRRACTR